MDVMSGRIRPKRMGRWLRRQVWSVWYEYVGHLTGAAPYEFLNFGFDHETEWQPLRLAADDEPDRLFINLYHKVAGEIDLRGRDVLEVGAGRGGGASYLYRYLQPARLLAVDRSARLITHGNEHHRRPGLHFERRDAEALELPSDSFDVVINIESSHAYGQRQRFLQQVWHVLRPGGSLLMADFFLAGAIATWERDVTATGFAVHAKEDITAGVLRSLDQSSALRLQAIRDLTPRWLSPLFRNFVGAQGSRVVRAMRTGRTRYLRYELAKAGGESRQELLIRGG